MICKKHNKKVRYDDDNCDFFFMMDDSPSYGLICENCIWCSKKDEE